MKKTIISLMMALTTAGVVSVNAKEMDSPAQLIQDSVIVEYNVMVEARDGVRLSTDIYRPAKPGKYPVILERHPYDNGGGSFKTGMAWAKKGYVFLRQDVRGRYDSEGGRHYPYMFEATDGFDVQEWAGKQVWSNGKVGMTGISYLASAQWLSAPLGSSSLVAIAPGMSPYNYYQDVAYMGGAFRLAGRASWAVLMGGQTNQKTPSDMNKILWHLPLKTLDKALGRDLPHLRDWLAHSTSDAYWDQFNVEKKAHKIKIPAYNMAGWYDAFLRGNLVSYQNLKSRAATKRARENQKLIIGPWKHHANTRSTLGEMDFGESAKVNFGDLDMRWYDHWLKGIDNGIMTEPPVRLFVMGENVWRDEDDWPLKRTKYTKYYFHSKGAANSLNGDGTLTTKRPKRGEKVDKYTYDPRNPVPSLGGNTTASVPAGPYDQAKIEQRDDILVFTTETLKKDVEVTGHLSVVLYAASSAKDTDFTAKLVDVHADGRAYNLADGIIRARFRESFEKSKLLKSGKIYKYKIDLWATSNLFKKGHKIRVDISSSNFPRFDRNPNTGHDFGQDGELQVAHQKIYHTQKYPSHIILPIIPR